jgi:thioredoxin-like negative regulator of GroEL
MWKKAVMEENMPWQQFLIPYKDMIRIKAQFLIGAVPTVVFVNEDRKIVKKFVGFTEKNVQNYKDFITKFITKESVRKKLHQE